MLECLLAHLFFYLEAGGRSRIAPSLVFLGCELDCELWIDSIWDSLRRRRRGRRWGGNVHDAVDGSRGTGSGITKLVLFATLCMIWAVRKTLAKLSALVDAVRESGRSFTTLPRCCWSCWRCCCSCGEAYGRKACAAAAAELEAFSGEVPNRVIMSKST